MSSRVKRILVLLAGWGCILLGILGLVLPVLQGVLFLLIGLVILSTEYLWAHRLLGKARERFPRISRTAAEVAAKAGHWLRRLSRQQGPN